MFEREQGWVASRRTAFLVLAVIGMSGLASAAQKERLTPQALWSMKRLGGPALSPDGASVAFTVQEWSIEKNKSTTSLWLADVASGTTRRLTAAAATDGAPEWDPRGKRLAFTSKRGDDENAALYVMPVDGGEAQKVLELPFAISGPRFMPDGRSVLVWTTVIPELAGTLAKADLAAMKKEIKRRKDSKMTAKVTEDRQYRYFDHYLTDGLANRLLLVDVETKGFRDLTPKYERLFTNSGEFGYDIAPDGKSVAISLNSTKPPYREFLNNDIYLVRTDGSGEMKNLTAENEGDDSSPLFAPDGKSLVFTRTTTPYYSGESRKLWRHDLATGKNLPLTTGLDYSIDEVRFAGDGKTLWLTAEERGFVPVFKLGADGSGLAAVHKTGTSTGLVGAGRQRRVPERRDEPAERALRPARGSGSRPPDHPRERRSGGAARPRPDPELFVQGRLGRRHPRLAGLSSRATTRRRRTPWCSSCTAAPTP